MKKALGIIQARCSSSRLPNKVLLPLAGTPMIHHIYNRAKSCSLLNDVIVATSSDKTDLPLVEYCKKNEIPVYTGSLNNVLSRYVKILGDLDVDYFVRITGDCPLIHPAFIDFQIELLRSHDADFIRLDPHMSILDGQGVMSKRSLIYISDNTKSPSDYEHVGAIYIEKNLPSFDIIKVKVLSNFDEIDVSLSVDEPEDFEFVSHIYRQLYDGDILDLTRVADFLKHNTILVDIQRRRRPSEINLTLGKRRLENNYFFIKEAIWEWS